MALLIIEGLELQTIIGVHAWERKITQKLYLDVSVDYDIVKSAQTDDLVHAVDYSTICQHLQDFAAQQTCHLIERLVTLLADTLTETFGFNHFELILHKPQAVASAKDIAIRLQR